MRAQVRETVGYPYLQGESDPLALRVVPGRAGHRRKSPRRRCAAQRHRVKAHCPRPRHPGGRRGHRAAKSS
jgi:hypothetical protein